MKTGSSQVGSHVSLADVFRSPALIVSFFLGVLKNVRLFAGYCLYGVNTFLMALALKGRELSRLVPDHRVDLRLGDGAFAVSPCR